MKITSYLDLDSKSETDIFDILTKIIENLYKRLIGQKYAFL